MEKVTLKGLTGVVVVLLSLGWPLNAFAQSNEGAMLAMPYGGEPISVNVPMNQSQVLDFPNPVKRLSVGNPEIADVVVVRSRQVYVLGKSRGTTNVMLWDNNDQLQGVLNIAVTHDLQTLKANLHDLLPSESIQVRSANDTIVLSGEVTNASSVDAAMRLASSFSGVNEDGQGWPILNMMQVGGAQQVMLDVKVAEVSRSLVKRLDVQFDVLNMASSSLKVGAVKGGALFPDAFFQQPGVGEVRIPALPGIRTPIGPMIDEFAPVTKSIEDAGIFASYQNGDYLLNSVIDAANREGTAKILAEPNLTTLTGEEARFLAGGEFPIPVPQGDGGITIDHKEFGVSLGFLPVVLDSGAINLKVDVAVSDLVNDNSIVVGVGEAGQVSAQFFVPALVKRSASSTLELGNGQTIAIAGMLNESLRENVSKFPGLGDIPILGALFRSQEFIKDQTELVIFVTARLARPITPEEIRLPTGNFVEPSDIGFYLLGRLHGEPEEQPRRETVDPLLNRNDGGTEGRFGHDL
ncbi:type II and III secretion system protein family protein [Marinobacter sp. SS21]|uniref:type II and III secretion system protein family protein n=1 Tax=Marinobacter sp. SS21 TaxID=2979460 RepID=UPI00232DD09C|nr:type II and III secretion system protein family protein [Marinobacter sp. SS21]MDC0663753.1 type II and III secretion system protein family protein [Marinobacter sp. SS21]